MSRNITVIPATGGPYRDLTIDPGTTARDIKKALGLSNDNVLTRGRGSEPIPDDENVYEAVSDGAKLYWTSPVEWGGELLDLLSHLFAPRKPQIRVTRTYQATGNEPLVVRREPRPYWMERGWVRDGNTYSGEYRTGYGQWQGWITESASGRVDTYIADPPSALERHPHWQCFRKRDNGWFFIHPVHDVRDVSAAILAVETTLAEAFHHN